MAFFDRLYMHWYHRFWKKHLLLHLQNKPKTITVLGPNDVMCPLVFIGENCSFGNGTYFRGRQNANIHIGNHVFLGDNITLMSFISIDIGDSTMIASNVYITDVNHGMEKSDLTMQEQPTNQRPVIIGKNVWIGTGVTILKGSVIHDGAVIGAGAVVDGDIPENAIAVGVPAKVIKYRK